MGKTLRIGTRGSALALRQTQMVMDSLRARYPDLAMEVVEIRTSGDWKPEQGETRLSEKQGGKGLFAKEIEQALLEGRIDCGVHSAKDMPSFLPEGLILRHMLPRADARDALLTNGGYTSIADLPAGAVVGTASTRRAAFLLAKRPDLKVTPLRGNVTTRIEKLRAGQVDAAILAVAGLERTNLTHEIAGIIEMDDMLPAAAQGAVAVELRAHDQETITVFDAIHCHATGLRVAAERAALAALDGSCHTPIGAHAVLDADGWLHLSVMVASLDGQTMFSEQGRAVVQGDDDAAALGTKTGMALKVRLPQGFLL